MTARGARLAHVALLIAGVGVFAALVHHVGAHALFADLHAFGWGILWVVALELVIDACNTAAWRATLPLHARVGFALLFWVRQAGVAINQVTPTATVGGEVVKALLLRPQVQPATAAASLVAARMSYALGQTALVLVGLSSILSRTQGTPDLARAIVVSVVATVAGVVGFVWLQRRGIFATLANGLTRFGIADRAVGRLRVAAHALDRQLTVFYRERPGSFAVSVGWHVVGQVVGLAQLFYVLGALGTPTPLATCLAIEAFALVIDSAAFLVPGRIGVQEAGRVLVFTTFGLGAATGLAVAVIVRLNQLAVVGIGLAAYATLSLRSPIADRA